MVPRSLGLRQEIINQGILQGTLWPSVVRVFPSFPSLLSPLISTFQEGIYIKARQEERERNIEKIKWEKNRNKDKDIERKKFRMGQRERDNGRGKKIGREKGGG